MSLIRKPKPVILILLELRGPRGDLSLKAGVHAIALLDISALPIVLLQIRGIFILARQCLIKVGIEYLPLILIVVGIDDPLL